MQPRIYLYEDLQKATNYFHPNMKLGQGAFGAVYKVLTKHFNIVRSLALNPKSSICWFNYILYWWSFNSKLKLLKTDFFLVVWCFIGCARCKWNCCQDIITRNTTGNQWVFQWSCACHKYETQESSETQRLLFWWSRTANPRIRVCWEQQFGRTYFW